MGFEDLALSTKGFIEEKVKRVIFSPLNDLIEENVTDVTTTIGSFIIRSIRGKFTRSISFMIGQSYADRWMEEALYGILYRWNDIKSNPNLELGNNNSHQDGSGMYYRLGGGTHSLKYRGYNILLVIRTLTPQTPGGRMYLQREYTVITYDLNPDFIRDFERDMIIHRNSLLQIKNDSPIVNVYKDMHESDGYTYWEKGAAVNKRRINTIYLPKDTKNRIIGTVNSFLSKDTIEFYKRHGVAHNLKILLYGPPGPQPVDTPTPTPDGIQRFGDLQVGDQVFNRRGKAVRISEIHDFEGKRDIYQLQLSDGRFAQSTIDHRWTVMVKNHGKWISQTIPLEEIMDSSREYFIPMNQAVEFNSRHTPIDPYYLGILIANGCLTDPYLRITQPDDEIPKLFAKQFSLYVKRRSDDPKDYNYIFYNKEGGERIRTSDFLKEVPELIGHKTGDKIIPDNYLYNDIDSRMALLQGLLDGDGSIVIRKGRIWASPMVRYSTTSYQLGKQVEWLIRSLGYQSSISYDMREKYSTGQCLDVRLSSITEHFLKFFRSKKKQLIASEQSLTFNNIKGTLRWHRLYDKSKIIKIVKLEKKEMVRCIKVDDPEHLYLTTDFVVTHNTGKDSIAKTIASEWNRNIYYVTGGKMGRFVPEAITSDDSDINSPVFIISDIDKYPFLINDTNVSLDDGEKSKEDQMLYKQIFGKMINALDGIMSAEHRIIVMTTNHIEKFSPTFLRAGRVDLMLEIGYVTPDVFRKYAYDNYGSILPKKITLKNNKLTIADMQFDLMFLKLTSDEFIKKYLK